MNSTVRHTLIENLSDIIIQKRPANSAFLVGITGMDTSGKTRFTEELERCLYRRGLKVQIIHVDDFHNPKSIRYARDLPEPRQYYERSINFERLANEVLRPIKEYGQLKTTLTHLDLLSDTWSLQRDYNVNSDTIVLVEGVFLFRPEICSFVDFFIYLHVTEDVVIQRARLRDLPTQGEEVMRKYHSKYLPAQREYIQNVRPDRFSDVVIDNSNWENPKVLVWPDEQ